MRNLDTEPYIRTVWGDWHFHNKEGTTQGNTKVFTNLKEWQIEEIGVCGVAGAGEGSQRAESKPMGKITIKQIFNIFLNITPFQK